MNPMNFSHRKIYTKVITIMEAKTTCQIQAIIELFC